MVFSTSPTRDSLSFEDFLDLLSVFSDTATPDIKSHYAFRIFGKNCWSSLLPTQEVGVGVSLWNTFCACLYCSLCLLPRL